jgi:uncharacterized membrane protein
MDKSLVAKKAFTELTSVQNLDNVITLREIKHRQIQARRHAAFMLRQRLIGVILLIVGLLVEVITKDITVLIFLAPFYLSAIFSKKYIMNFNQKERK